MLKKQKDWDAIGAARCTSAAEVMALARKFRPAPVPSIVRREAFNPTTKVEKQPEAEPKQIFSFPQIENVEKPRLTERKVLKEVCFALNINVDDVTGMGRTKECVNARHLSIYLARLLLRGRRSYPQIARGLGLRDHSTAIYAFNKIEKRLRDESELKQTIEGIKKSLRERYSGVPIDT